MRYSNHVRGFSSKEPEKADGETNASLNKGAGAGAASISLCAVVVVTEAVAIVVETIDEVTVVVGAVITATVVVVTVDTTVDTVEATVVTAVVTVVTRGKIETAVVVNERGISTTAVVAAKCVVETSGADDELFEYTVIVPAPVVLIAAEIRVPCAIVTKVCVAEITGLAESVLPRFCFSKTKSLFVAKVSTKVSSLKR